mmetsp:Transcript_28444/g.31933  ORF Transcript_28444/g.31933 Transcript_28444/m.31933 type:complete len:87 (+) Transcript_28444:80-340(+)
MNGRRKITWVPSLLSGTPRLLFHDTYSEVVNVNARFEYYDNDGDDDDEEKTARLEYYDTEGDDDEEEHYYSSEDLLAKKNLRHYWS